MAKLPAPEQLLTNNDVAALCQVSSKTVRRWITAGELPAAQLGAQCRIRPRDVDLFIHERMER
ncbi:MAG: helix-turn-helix domain-containing protein [Alphaproteobacteria bacterium]|nr:helix-turn-helix domain-containing protein [Alphaproteobacteria bacterium]